MDFIKRNYTATRKYVQHWINPNENPTDLDKYAFNLLEKAEVDLFIEFMEMNKVNINVVDYSKISLLIKAQGIPTYTNQHTKLLTEEELERRAVKAINYLVKKGCDINYRGKNGATALLSASHWGYYSIVKALLLHGANPNIQTQVQGFCTSPLLSAIFKGHKQIAKLLVFYGAEPKRTEMLSAKTTGFKLDKQHLQYLYTVYHIYLLTYRRRVQQEKGVNSVLAQLSENQFNQICMCV